MNGWKEIYSQYEAKKKEGNEQALRYVKDEIQNAVNGDENRFLLLKAQKMAEMKNIDPNLHISIIALVVGAAAFVAAILSVICGTVPNSMGILGCIIAVVGLVAIVFVVGYAACMMKKVIKFMQMQEVFNVFFLYMEEYEKKHF